MSSLASLRVKADGHANRVNSLVERLETAHEPALESMRGEMVQARAQDRRDLDAEIAALRTRLQQASEGSEDTIAEVREGLRQTRAEVAALSLLDRQAPLSI